MENADPVISNEKCAACMYLRKKCAANCQLAPYFPSDRTEDFQNVYQLFGVSNIINMLNSVDDDDEQKGKMAESLILEAKIRKENPVYGCLAIERKLRLAIQETEKELEIVQKTNAFYKEMAKSQMQK
ncbi:PREDICTED: LOB domain-containing protein 22-like [Nicotiana attenuata]|uniref:Lob domain-containing protein 27 n=1 Tax=Nicotiana attenuata TaxID=49451 RepID=A0A314KT00_NICAT|nr:PREDICTED: LOB domain-containing protein 22-like [Nicotiana attenuata]OIT32452.1 lob domain-containing protein 27 [Nicotiana attenuata]OIT32453.1 lob domain-containing protein 27 [Nicotiana attenuata]